MVSYGVSRSFPICSNEAGPSSTSRQVFGMYMAGPWLFYVWLWTIIINKLCVKEITITIISIITDHHDNHQTFDYQNHQPLITSTNEPHRRHQHENCDPIRQRRLHGPRLPVCYVK